MVSLPESDENQNLTALKSPSFQDMLDCDASSEYDTDLEEDFPGILVSDPTNSTDKNSDRLCF